MSAENLTIVLNVNPILCYLFDHYENAPIQMYWKFYNQKMKIFR